MNDQKSEFECLPPSNRADLALEEYHRIARRTTVDSASYQRMEACVLQYERAEAIRARETKIAETSPK